MNRSLLWGLVAVVGFVAAWALKSWNMPDGGSVMGALQLTIAAFLTLCVFSFLYKDNPFYKLAEHLFVGVSAAYWMVLAFWNTIVGSLVPRLSAGLSGYFQVPTINDPLNMLYWVPVALGVMLLLRLSEGLSWLSRWTVGFTVGITSGLYFTSALRSNVMEQILASFLPLGYDANGAGGFSLSVGSPLVIMLTNWLIVVGVITALIFFYFSKEHKGWFGSAARIGTWVLMLTFGASFGYTVMGRISLLIGRISFLFRDFLGVIS